MGEARVFFIREAPLKNLHVAILSMFFVTPVSAAELQCKTISQTVSGNMGSTAEAVARVTAADFAAGYRVTGGGCDLSLGGSSFGLVMWSKPVDGGYSCKTRAVNDNAAVQAVALATLCRVGLGGTGEGLSRAPFNNVGLGGGTIGIARAVKGGLPYGVRVCNLYGGVPIEVDLSATSRVPLNFGQCVEVDRPQWAFFRTPTTVDIVQRGGYELFQPGIFPIKQRVGRATQVELSKYVGITGPMKSAVAKCKKPAPDEPFDRKSFLGYCPLSELGSNKNYRVCFDIGFSGQGDKLEYPGSLLPIVMEKALMAKREPANGQINSNLYLSISAESCRDIFGVSFASILILDNKPWNGQEMGAVTYRFVEIPPPVSVPKGK